MSDSDKGKGVQRPELNEKQKARRDEIRNSWRNYLRVTTLPAWAQKQNEIIHLCKASLPDVDEETKEIITRELLFTLRCHGCERARSNECHFSVCVRGLMSGKDIKGL